MKRMLNTKKTILFLESFFRYHPDGWFSINYITDLVRKKSWKENWFSYFRVGRLLRSEFLAKDLVEVSQNGRWWRSKLQKPNNS